MFYDDELRVKDMKVDGEGIFHFINNIDDTLFEGLDIDIIELGFQLKHGNRLISPFMKDTFKVDDKNTSFDNLAKIIITMYGSKWKKMIEFYSKDLELESYNLNTKETDNIIDSRTNVRTDVTENERTDKKSGFDSETLVDDLKEIANSNLDSTDTTESNVERIRDKQVSGNISNKLDDSMKYLKLLQNTVLNDIIYRDVSELVSLLIY